MFFSFLLQSKEVGLQLQEDLMKVLNELYTVRYKDSLVDRNNFIFSTDKNKSEAIIFLQHFHVSFSVYVASLPQTLKFFLVFLSQYLW